MVTGPTSRHIRRWKSPEKKRCWRYNWVLEFDIKGLFDNIDHEFLMKAVRKHTDNRWLLLYIERWLTAPIQLSDGTTIRRERGVPQGGVINPVLSSGRTKIRILSKNVNLAWSQFWQLESNFQQFFLTPANSRRCKALNSYF